MEVRIGECRNVEFLRRDTVGRTFYSSSNNFSFRFARYYLNLDQNYEFKLVSARVVSKVSQKI